MNGKPLYTFPLLHDYTRIRVWLLFLSVVALIVGGAEAYRREFIGAAACVVFIIFAIRYALVIGRAVRTPARIAAMEEIIGAQLWFWRLAAPAAIAFLAGLLLRPPA